MHKASTDTNVIANVKEKTDANKALTRKETREIITPYAFHVSEDLFGTPLASPTRRGSSMLIDLILVALLTQLSSLALAAVAAFTFFRAGNRLKQKKRFNGVRIFLRFLTAVLLFVLAFGIFEEFNDHSEEMDTFKSADFEGVELSDAESLEVLGVAAKYFMQTAQLKKDVKSGKCVNAYECWEELGDRIIKDIDELGVSKEKALSFLNTFIEASEDSLTTAQNLALREHMENVLELRLKASNKIPEGSPSYASEAVSLAKDTTQQKIDDAIKLSDNLPPKEKNIIESLEELAEEFGWGVGWAAFYFSLFTAWWRGQTPGKRLLGIKVIKLDGGYLNLWESFGRYGGYSAGLATGLSGFLQVYWDPNRQAIQDKISETLVINIRKPKVAFDLDAETNSVNLEK